MGHDVQASKGRLIKFIVGLALQLLFDHGPQPGYAVLQELGIIQHHPRQAGRGDQGVFGIYEAPDGGVRQYFPAIEGFQVMIQPVLIQRFHPIRIFLTQGGDFLLENPQLIEHAVMAHAAYRRDRAKPDG